MSSFSFSPSPSYDVAKRIFRNLTTILVQETRQYPQYKHRLVQSKTPIVHKASIKKPHMFRPYNMAYIREFLYW